MKLAGFVILAACWSTPIHSSAEPTAADASAVAALRDSKFVDAARLATDRLAIDPRDPNAAAVRAIASYEQAAAAVYQGLDLRNTWFAFEAVFKAPPTLWQTAIDKLDTIDRDLAIAADDPDFALELCIACWNVDWNHDGKIDDRDLRLLEIERDDHGDQLPDNDPRRRPTFRFDAGDVEWARAMIAFQRAAIELLLAYDWSKADAGTIRLISADRVKRAHALVLAGLDFSDRERRAYLAETDDDREWVPNPRQHSAVPLAVDQALYDTWEHVVGDVRRMMTGDEGISLRELGVLIDPRHADDLPDAYIDVGQMFARPMDITIDDKDRGGSERETTARVLRGILGHGYVEHMKPSPLVGRLATVKSQLERGGDELDHKLRFLLWIN